MSKHRSSSIGRSILGGALVGILSATAGCAGMVESNAEGTFYWTSARVAHRTIADGRLGIFVREHVSLAGVATLGIRLYNLTEQPIEVEIESIRAIDYSRDPGAQTLQPRSVLHLPIIKVNVGSAYGIAHPVMSFRIGDHRYTERFIVRARRYDWEWQAVIHNPSIPDSADEYLRLPEGAWILWFQNSNPKSEESSWQEKDSMAYDSQVACEAAMERTLSYHKKYKSQAETAFARSIADVQGNIVLFRDGKAMAYSCLPDTIDPRGPKGR